MNETIRPCPLRKKFFRRERRSVPAARKLAYEFLADWGFAGTERGDDVLLCVSELATNALLHGVPPGRQFMLFLRYDGWELRVAVHDSGGGFPRLVEESEEADESEAEGGRGLLLVSALSDRWGVGDRELGKVVWCDWDLPIDPAIDEALSRSLSRSR